MRAAMLTGPGRLDLVEWREEPRPGPREVLAAVRRVGICGTDYHAYNGTQNFIVYPCVLGHELAVEVVQIGSEVADLQVGDLCAVLPYVSCGLCGACRRGRTNCCERIEVLGITRAGGLRERMVVPAAQLFHAAGLSLDQLVLVETLGIGWHAVARSRPDPADTVLVLGAGPIGLAVAHAARPRVRQVLIADISAGRVGFAATTGLEALTVGDDLEAQVRDRTGGPLPSLVFDASGNPSSMEASFSLVGAGGRLVFVGHTRASLTFDNPGFHARELELRASRNATPADWVEVVSAVLTGVLDARSWVNHRMTFDVVVDELPRLASDPGRVVKAVVEVDPAEGGDGPHHRSWTTTASP
jgi:2-desacetyl-2-hydroxyethyl bacteriochlorophyllide A dehydrogenase